MHDFSWSKQAVSAAVSSGAAPAQSPPPNGSAPHSVNKASIAMPNGATPQQERQKHETVATNAISDPTVVPFRSSNGSATLHAHPSFPPKPALASDDLCDNSPIVEEHPAAVRHSIKGETTVHTAGAGAALGQAGSASGSSASSADLLDGAERGEVDTKQGGAGVNASSTESWDETGPWAFANQGTDAAKMSTAGVGASQVIFCATLDCVVDCVCCSFWAD